MTAPGTRIYFDDPPRLDQVSFAVIPVDSFSGRLVSDGVTASVEGLLDRPIRNLSGYLVFINLPAQAQYAVRVVPTAAKYLPPPATVFVPPAANDPDVAAKRRHVVRMVPRPDFYFADTTVVRGVVVRGGQNAVPAADARIWVDAFISAPPFETRSDVRGGFALPISLPDENNANHPVKGTLSITINFQHGAHTRALTKVVTDGRSHSFKEPIDLVGTNNPDFFDPYQS